MHVNDQVLWHEILAAVLRQYAGQKLPYELVVRKPAELGSERDTVFVNDRPDGLHIKLISQSEADRIVELMRADPVGLPC